MLSFSLKCFFLAYVVWMQIGICRAQLIDSGILDQADIVIIKRSISMNSHDEVASSITNTLLQNEKRTLPLKLSLVPLSLGPEDHDIQDILKSTEGNFHIFLLLYVRFLLIVQTQSGTIMRKAPKTNMDMSRPMLQHGSWTTAIPKLSHTYALCRSFRESFHAFLC